MPESQSQFPSHKKYSRLPESTNGTWTASQSPAGRVERSFPRSSRAWRSSGGCRRAGSPTAPSRQASGTMGSCAQSRSSTRCPVSRPRMQMAFISILIRRGFTFDHGRLWKWTDWRQFIYLKKGEGRWKRKRKRERENQRPAIVLVS